MNTVSVLAFVTKNMDGKSLVLLLSLCLTLTTCVPIPGKYTALMHRYIFKVHAYKLCIYVYVHTLLLCVPNCTSFINKLT